MRLTSTEIEQRVFYTVILRGPASTADIAEAAFKDVIEERRAAGFVRVASWVPTTALVLHRLELRGKVRATQTRDGVLWSIMLGLDHVLS